MCAKSFLSAFWRLRLKCFCLVLALVLVSDAFVYAVRSDSSSSAVSEEVQTESNWNIDRKISSADGALQFRVDNVVKMTRNEREVSFSSSTVFYGDLVFDFVGDNGEIVVFSFTDDKFALIDPIRRMRAELNLDEVERFIARIDPILRDKDDRFVNFMLQPKFETSKKEDEFFFQSKFIDYRVATRSFEDDQIANAYFQFSNALGKLNVYMNPGTITPLARIEVNQKLAESSRFPEKIITDVYPKGKNIFSKTVRIVNESTLARRLSERDRNRINRALHFYAQFPLVSFQTYFEKTSER